MSVVDSTKIDGILAELRAWPSSDRLRLARKILEMLEAATLEPAPHPRSIMDLVGVLKTDAPAPTDEECQAILEEELIKKHLGALYPLLAEIDPEDWEDIRDYVGK